MTTEMGWREVLATMDENTGTEAERIEVIRLRGEYAQDLARIERRHQEERNRQAAKEEPPDDQAG